MATKDNFTADEWNKVVQGVMMSGIAVTAAEPNGLFGTLKEAAASGSAMGAAKSDPAASALIKSVVAHMETPEGRTATRNALKLRFEGAKPKEISQRCVETLREVAKLVDTKAPAEAPAFKIWILNTSKKVAEASKEGSFLGFGGQKVSDNEKATIDQVSKALGLH
jgi:hypothetical protein